jgi:hypothetical protein
MVFIELFTAVSLLFHHHTKLLATLSSIDEPAKTQDHLFRIGQYIFTQESN